MTTLQKLGEKFNTDKSHPSHSYKGKTYCDVYDKYFKDIRHEVKVVVEIGVLGGASLKMWEEYFPNATIYGIDINPKAEMYRTDRIKIIVGDQNDEGFLQSVKEQIGEIDILIDDGSHINRHIIHSYNVLSPIVKRFYIVEDLMCSYEETNNDLDLRKIWEGAKFNDPEDDLKNYRHEIMDWIKDKTAELDTRKSRFNSIHFYSEIIIFSTE